MKIQYLKFSISLIFAYTLTLSAVAQAVDPDAFQKGLTNGTQLLDVRTAAEYKTSHIANSLQADWNNREQFKERLKYMDKNKPVYVYCAAGIRSEAAAKWMRENGFSEIKELSGGLKAWNTAHKPTEGLPNEEQISSEAFMSLLQKSDHVLVEFGASWCPPCVQMKPVIAELQKNLKNKFKLIQFDPVVQTALASQLQIEGIPTFIVYKNSKEVYRKQGVTTYDELKDCILK